MNTRLNQPQAPAQHAWTRPELALVLAAAGLLACVGLPALGRASSRSEQAVCVNNLRQIGRAYAQWGISHDGLPPQLVPVADGGTSPASSGPAGAQNAWYQFAWLSNELHTPRILACPSDPKRQPAQDFSASPEGGLLHVSQRNQAVSYAFAPDRRLDLPDYVAAMDRDLRVTAAGRACSAGFSSVAAIDYLTPNEPAWTNELHFQSGNILSHDGRVDQISQSGLARRLRTSSWTGSLHLLIP